ncbi:MAG: non-ribosomal peptide synthetase [Chloroflexi bacterium]|jgi:non-ribosomal peptide synthetase-like protein|nr:non-ribosomal peptide synthetase [Chloroflexota bacterium]
MAVSDPTFASRLGLATLSPARKPVGRLHHLFETTCDRAPDAIAVECADRQASYRDLDRQSNRLAHRLIGMGVAAGDRVGILLPRSLETYASVLGVLKAGATFVPIDPGYPADRIAFIAADAGLRVVITTAALAATAAQSLGCPALELDEPSSDLARMADTRPRADAGRDSLAYIIYTSGSTGRPKGVAVSHGNICDFLGVVTPIYAVTDRDRVYQGMTIAFDFSIEEIWPAWMVGATVVAGPTDASRLGPQLADLLEEREVTVLCCVPTLLATIDHEVPSLRTLIVGGEACPRDLVQRWTRPGRRMLNTYGPTETTVTATWCELVPDRPVTIGRPLPSYTVQMLDEQLRPLPAGEPGEICIGGPCVAQGYVNRPELTAERFVADPSAPGARMYRTGDLGRLSSSGEIEFLGRLDTQVKIRGYRIELGEIEAVIREEEAVENVVVSALEHDGAATDLVGYVTLRRPASAPDELRQRLHDRLRRRLPSYMVPAFIEVLDGLPTLAGSKVARSHLPAPVSPRLGLRAEVMVPPATPLEVELLAVWAEVFGHADISVEADFFLDLGGHSLFAAMVVSRLRRRPGSRSVGIGDLYERPTIRALADHLQALSTVAAVGPHGGSSPDPRPAPLRHRGRRVLVAGAAQLAGLYALVLVLGAPAGWLLALSGGTLPAARLALGALILPPCFLVTSLVLPVAARWTLAARVRPGRHPLWGATYVRWWMFTRLLGLAPLRLLAGSPLMPPYLRLLGARIGDSCQIATERIQTPWLTEIGAGASVGYGVDVMPAVVEDGWLLLDPVRIGAGAVVGTGSVLLGGAEMGRGSRLAEQSLLARGERLPEGQSWAGSPAALSTEGDPLLDAMEAAGHQGRRWSKRLHLGFAAGVAVLGLLPFLMALPATVLITLTMVRWGLVAAIISTLVAGPVSVISACALVAAGRRLALPRTEPGIHPLRSSLGLRKWFADRLMAMSLEITNTLYATLYAVPWLRLLGARVGTRSEVSTAAHIDPDLLTLGEESFVADFASVGAATFAAGTIALGRTELGRRCFVGNAAVVRSHTRLGAKSLIGVQSVAPAKQVEPETAWLGSPAIFLPRRQQSEGFSERVTYRPSRTLVAARLFVEYFRVTLPATLISAVVLVAALLELRVARQASASLLIAVTPVLAFAAGLCATLAVVALKWLLVGRYRPRVEPLWAMFVRRSELITGLYESVAVPALLGMLTGTPWIGPVLRLLGARVGRRVCLQTTYLTEFDLVQVGDDACVGASASLQTHLFEDRVMKMSTVALGRGSTVGARAVVLYDAQLAAGAVLDALSLAMKGESLPAGGCWRGIPAGPVA